MVARVDRADCRNESSTPVSLKTVAIDLTGAGEIGTVRAVQRAVGRALAFSRLTVTGSDLKRQPKTGAIVGTVSFTGGRIAVESWPSTGYVALDIQGVLRPEMALTAFADAFDAREAVVKKLRLPSDGARFKKPLATVRGTAARKAA
ncbi:MAG: S-adenosylmethionine decarboxylase [Hyphomicrobium sp.]|nr:S-adenosylmethionine decarboxylase [Hyphomicrobium sp.]